MSRKKSESESGYKYSETPSARKDKKEKAKRNLRKKAVFWIVIIAALIAVFASLLMLFPPSSEGEQYTPLCLEFERIDKREADNGWWTRFNVSYDGGCYDEMIAHGHILNLTFQYEFVDGPKSSILSARIELVVPPAEGTAHVYTPQFHFSKEPISMQVIEIRCE